MPWRAPGGRKNAQTLIVFAARHKARLLRMSGAAGAPVGLVVYDVVHVVASATWLDDTPGGLRGVAADETALLRASLTTVAGLVRQLCLRIGTESKDVTRFCHSACATSAGDAAVFGDVFCVCRAEEWQYFDPAPFLRGRAMSTKAYRVVEGVTPRFFALYSHPCVVVTGAQAAFDALLVACATAAAFCDDGAAAAAAVLGDLCDSAPYADVASAYEHAEAESATDAVAFLAAMGEPRAQADLDASLARAIGTAAPPVLSTALFSMATATSSVTETVFLHICGLATASRAAP